MERLRKKKRDAAGEQPRSLLASNPYLPGQEKTQPEAKAEHNRASEVRVILAKVVGGAEKHTQTYTHTQQWRQKGMRTGQFNSRAPLIECSASVGSCWKTLLVDC